MADVKISQLPTATTVADADILVINQGGVTKQATRALVTATSGILPVANGGTGVAASSGANSVVLRDANQNISANVVSEAFQTIVKSASTLTLTASSVRQYVLTGSATGQNINIPLVTTLQNGDVFYFINRGSTSIAINNSDGANFANLIGSSSARIVIVDNTDNAGGFHISYFAPRTAAWSETALSFSGAISQATWSGNTITHNRGGTGQTSYTDGQLLIGNTTNGALSKATLTAGSNVTITNGNGSITIAATGGSATPTDIQVFTSSGTWTKPAGARLVIFDVVGAGGGGGAGGKAASGTAIFGGGGGGGGGYTPLTYAAADLADASYTVTVGAGGAGGIFSPTTSATAGGVSTIFGATQGTIARASGGGAGGAGTTTTGASGIAGTYTTNNGGASSITATAGGGSGGGRGPASGAAGGGCSTSAPFAGGIGGSNVVFSLAGGNGGALSTTANGGAGANGNLKTGLASALFTGTGGGGGGASTFATGSGGIGGNGTANGCGGGGGGATQGSGNGGDGGNGGAGIIVVTTYF